MCNSGECEFEDYFGVCSCDYKNFEKKYKFSACLVGGRIRDEEEKTYYMKHKEEIDAIINDYYQNK